MAARPVRRDGDHMRNLLRVLHRNVETLAADDPRASALVEREFRLDQLGMVLDQPSHAVVAPLLLVRVGDEDDIPRQRAPLVDHVPLEEQHGLEMRREHPLVVDRAAPVQVAVLDLRGEGIDRPVRALDADDVHVPHDDDGLLAPIALEPRDECSAARRRLEQVCLDPGRLELFVQELAHLHLIAGRVHRVHPDHRLQVRERLVARGIPVGLLGGEGRGGESHQEGE